MQKMRRFYGLVWREMVLNEKHSDILKSILPQAGDNMQSVKLSTAEDYYIERIVISGVSDKLKGVPASAYLMAIDSQGKEVFYSMHKADQVKWDGYVADTYFSGVLVKDSDEDDMIKVTTFFMNSNGIPEIDKPCKVKLTHRQKLNDGEGCEVFRLNHYEYNYGDFMPLPNGFVL